MSGVAVLIHAVTRVPPLSVIPDQLRLRQRTRKLPFSLLAHPLMGGVRIELSEGSSA